MAKLLCRWACVRYRTLQVQVPVDLGLFISNILPWTGHLPMETGKIKKGLSFLHYIALKVLKVYLGSQIEPIRLSTH